MKQSIFSAFIFIFAVIISSNVYANDGEKSKLPKNFFLKTLDNGLEILIIEDPSVPLATIEFCVRNGAYTESPEYDGLSHLYEHMFFKANEDYPSQEAFMNRIAELGAVFNGTTSVARVNYFITLGSSNVIPGLEFMNSAIQKPLFLKKEMEKENLVVDGEFERNEASPFFFLRDEMDRQLWGNLYSRKNTIGDHEIIKTATPEKMYEIQKKYYHPNNTLIAIAGDVDHKKMFTEIERVMGDWKNSGFNAHEKYKIPEFDPLTESKGFIVENPNTRVPILMRSWHGPDTRESRKYTYIADLFSKMLSQKTSKFQQNLVDSGLALQVSESYYTNLITGPINITMVPNPASVKEAVDALDAEIGKWADKDYFNKEQLATAKNLIAIDEAYGQEKTSAFIHTCTFWWGTADINYAVSYVDKINEVSLEDIQEYVKKYILNKPNRTGMLVTPEMRSSLGIDAIMGIE